MTISLVLDPNIDDVLYCLDHKNMCTDLFIDPSKTFDMIDHVLLVQSFSEIDRDQASCNWFKNYLTDRTQCVLTDGIKSSFLKITKVCRRG